MIEGVHIWRAALDEDGWPGPERLPGPEQERFDAFLRPQPARRWLASRWALRRVLASYLGQEPTAVELEVEERGKPRLRDGDELEFNLSHSNGLALIAVTTGRAVGVDVEMVEPNRDLVALAERALPPEDVATVRAALPVERPALFYAAWTRHEAGLKCLGLGLSDTSLRASAPAAPDRKLVAVENIEVAPEYAAAVAAAGPEVGPVNCRSLRAG